MFHKSVGIHVCKCKFVTFLQIDWRGLLKWAHGENHDHISMHGPKAPGNWSQFWDNFLLKTFLMQSKSRFARQYPLKALSLDQYCTVADMPK